MLEVTLSGVKAKVPEFVMFVTPPAIETLPEVEIVEVPEFIVISFPSASKTMSPTASIVQSGITTGAGYIVKKSTGKTITEHALDAINQEVVKQSFAPKNKIHISEKINSASLEK